MIKKLCLLCLISYQPYIIWSSVLVHLCNAFSIFSKFWFSGLLVGKRTKWPGITKKLVCLTLHLRNHTSCDCGDDMFSFISFFFLILIVWVSRKGGGGGGGGKKGKKMTHNYQFQSVTLSISGTVDHIIKIFSTQEIQWILSIDIFFNKC